MFSVIIVLYSASIAAVLVVMVTATDGVGDQVAGYC